MIRKVVGGIGFSLVILGVGCVDSPSMLLPAVMIVAGAIMIAVCTRLEGKWIEK